MSRLIVGLLLALPLLPTAMVAWDAPLPIQQPLTVVATGGASTVIIVRDDGDVASINVRAPRRCYQIVITDAGGQQITIADRSACGRVVWLPMVQ